MNEAKIIKAPCRGCHRETNQTILCCDVTSESQDWNGSNIWWQTTSEMLKCLGCGTVSLRRSVDFSEEPEESISYYPPPVARRMPVWRHRLPVNMQLLMSEVYAALDADSKRLTLMGARTIVDMLILDKVGDVGSFAEKLRQMEVEGFVSSRGRKVLEAALDAGNAAAHRGFRPQEDDLSNVMDIVENMLQAAYVLEGAAEKLRSKTPARKIIRTKPSK